MERRRRLGPGDHLSAELIIEVRLADGAWTPTAEDLVVVVEPAYGVPAVAAALDAGWDSVDIAQAPTPPGAPIPLVSFEQPARRDAGEDEVRCRVRSDDLYATLERATSEGATPILAAAVNARPAMSGLARACAHVERVAFIPAAHVLEEEDGDELLVEALTVDGIWGAGMLIRILLEELDLERPVRLADGAGIAVTVAQGAEDVAAQLTAGARWHDHLAAGGHADDLRVASAIDSIPAVPIVRREVMGEDADDVLIATGWQR